MRKYIGLFFLVMASSCFSLSPPIRFPDEGVLIQEKPADNLMDFIIRPKYPKPLIIPLHEIKNMLNNHAGALSIPLINKVLTTLTCSNAYHVQHNQILTVIDYSLPSNQKRLWIFDLKQKKLLFHTFISHGITSGALLTNYFSNINNSKATSLGVYKTEKTYYGRDGLSLRLNGLERGFNDNANNRYIVMHGAWYVDEQFIKKYGRPGRSWGCPALPIQMTGPIINTIKDNSLFVVYYPSETWLAQSKFLHCEKASNEPQSVDVGQTLVPPDNTRDDILFADLHKNNRREDTSPVIAMKADSYEHLFHAKVPLERMLRRQINNVEYIALNHQEFKKIADSADQTRLNALYFIKPEIKNVRGYYETQMKIMNFGKIKTIAPNPMTGYTVYFDAKPAIILKLTNQFIRWVGL
jgi:hypothetical protein